jgi:hypothetical protein
MFKFIACKFIKGPEIILFKQQEIYKTCFSARRKQINIYRDIAVRLLYSRNMFCAYLFIIHFKNRWNIWLLYSCDDDNDDDNAAADDGDEHGGCGIYDSVI